MLAEVWTVKETFTVVNKCKGLLNSYPNIPL